MSDLYESLEAQVSVLVEALLSAALLAGATGRWWTGRRRALPGRPGWRSMVAGPSLLAAMATMDLVDEFWPDVWLVAGQDTEPLAEDLLLPLAGVGLLVSGILRWVPMHAQLAALQAERQAAEIARLREMDAFKTTFLNTAAHELATPLTPIRVHLSMMQHESSDVSGLDLLDRNVARLERLVKDLLDASRLQTGKLRFDMRPVDVADLMDELEASFAEACATEGISFTIETGRDLRVEAADQARISQVLYNLVGNAMKFSPSGGSIRVTARREDRHVLVVVEDTGPGLDPAELAGLFQPFQQYHRDLVGPHVGTGLGLYVSQSIAMEHGGIIQAHSLGRGHGARFVLRLPVEAVDEEALAPAAPWWGRA